MLKAVLPCRLRPLKESLTTKLKLKKNIYIYYLPAFKSLQSSMLLFIYFYVFLHETPKGHVTVTSDLSHVKVVWERSFKNLLLFSTEINHMHLKHTT